MPSKCLSGGGELGALMRSLDWSKTSLGPVEIWPGGLRTAIGLCLNASSPALLCWGPELSLLYNDGFRPFLGAARHPGALGRPLLEAWPEGREVIGPELTATRSGEPPSRRKDAFLPLARNGSLEERYFSLSHAPVFDEARGVGGVLTTFHEITDRVIAERRLRALRALADHGLESASPKRVCEAAARVLAQSAFDVPFALFYLADAQRSSAELAAAVGLAPGSPAAPARIPLDGCGPEPDPWGLSDAAGGDGEVLSKLQHRLGPLPGGPWPEPASSALVVPLPRGGDPAGFLVAGISPRLALDNAYREFLDMVAARVGALLQVSWARLAMDQAREHVEQARRAKDEFLSMLGHELRNPLAPITTALQLMRLRGGDALSTEQRVVERQVKHLVRLVDDLLDVSRVTRGKVQLRRRPIELAQVVARAVEAASPLLEERRHQLRVEVPRQGLQVDADELRLEQVMTHLVNNAARYTDPGGRIEIRARREGDSAALVVSDNGMGIAPELLPRVFDLFVQGTRPRFGQAGLGLGLSLVRSLVELHGGTVQARSGGPGKGSELLVSLPLAAVAGRSAPGHQAWASPASGVRCRVLVVDDNRDAAELMADALRELGYDTLAAYDGPSGLELACRFQPEVAVVDIGLPVMDGYEVARRLRELPGARTQVVAVTGYGQESDRLRSLEAGFAMHLVKPVDLEILARSIKQLSEPRPADPDQPMSSPS